MQNSAYWNVVVIILVHAFLFPISAEWCPHIVYYYLWGREMPKGTAHSRNICPPRSPRYRKRLEKMRNKAIWDHYPKYQTILFFPDCEMGSLPFQPKCEKVAHSFQKSIWLNWDSFYYKGRCKMCIINILFTWTWKSARPQGVFCLNSSRGSPPHTHTPHHPHEIL